MSKYSAGKRALGVCDRCGFVYKLKKLREEYQDRARTGLLVCSTCWDPDHPQLQVGKYPVNDPETLRNPRPDTATHAQSRASFVPVYAVSAAGFVGQVGVTVS